MWKKKTGKNNRKNVLLPKNRLKKSNNTLNYFKSYIPFIILIFIIFYLNKSTKSAKDLISEEINKDLIYEEINKRINNGSIYTNIVGGLGNQLFMLFNIISLASKYRKNFYISFDENYKTHPSCFNYKLFKNIENKKIDTEKNNYKNIKEKNYTYHEIILENPNDNYELTGYFQSYKYFWDYKEEIKKYLYIDIEIIDDILSKYKLFGKKILSIHVRLGDYVNLQDFHPIPSLEYYKKALSYYNLNNYKIILFSNDIEKAKEMFSPLELDLIFAQDIYDNDEDQLYMLMLSDVVVCANSTFSLMACYLNEMYGFNKEAEYILPHKMFGKLGPSFNIEDHRLNYKFYYINYENIENIYKPKYDVFTTLHSKDKDRYKIFLNHNKKYLTESGNFYYVSYHNYDDINAIHIEESKYPFSKNDVIEYIKDYIPDYRWGWYYQQLLKLYCFKLINSEYVLIFDSDILFLNSIKMFENKQPLIFKRNTGNGSIHKPYLECQKYILPELEVEEFDSGICHFMLFKKNIIEKMLNEIEESHNKTAWKAMLDGVIHYIKKNSYEESILSEYELYYNYIKKANLYGYKKDFNYIDHSLKTFDINNENNKKYNMIADHHYQSQSHEDDWKKDNLIEEQIENKKIMESLISKYSGKNLQFNKIYEDLYPVIVNKVFKNNINKNYVFNELKSKFNKDTVYSIIYEEAKNITIKFRENIDSLINIYIKNIPSSLNNSKPNKYIKKVSTNINNNEQFYFGVVVPVYNRYYITKIFLECLKKNINFDSIVFCIVDDGSDNNVLRELENIGNTKHIIVYCNRINNIYSSYNTIVPGSMYPMTLYIGHELLKDRCKILSVLDSDAFIDPNYFKICKEFTETLDMDNTIFSGFNSLSKCHKILEKTSINSENILKKNMVGGISQFYSTNLYEQFKYKFTGEESFNLWAYDYDYQISNFMNNNNKQYICIEKSIVQHIGIKTSMIRHNNKLKNNEKIIIRDVYNILTDTSTKDNLKIEFDFDKHLQFNKNIIDPIFNNVWINSFIDKIYYINLDERTDRKEIMEKQFKHFGISNYERISAVKPQFNPKYSNQFINNQIEIFLKDEEIVDDLILDIPKKYIADFSKEYIRSKSSENRRKYILGALGCKMSHLNILRLSKEKNYDNILMIEDDALFHSNFIGHFNKLIENLRNIDYDMIWLSPNWLYKDNSGLLNRCNSYKYINDNFAQVDSSLSIDGNYGSTLSNAGNIFSKKCINFILENFDNTKQQEIDVWYRNNIQVNNKVYTTIPNLITQRVEKSNIEEYQINYDKDIHYKTRQKFNIFTIVKEENKEIYLNNLKNNLQKMIGYEKIYYLSKKKLFDNEILHHVNINNLESNLQELKEKFHEKVTDNNIKYFYYMDVNTYLKGNFFPFDENNNLILKNNMYKK